MTQETRDVIRNKASLFVTLIVIAIDKMIWFPGENDTIRNRPINTQRLGVSKGDLNSFDLEDLIKVVAKNALLFLTETL